MSASIILFVVGMLIVFEGYLLLLPNLIGKLIITIGIDKSRSRFVRIIEFVIGILLLVIVIFSRQLSDI